MRVGLVVRSIISLLPACPVAAQTTSMSVDVERSAIVVHVFKTGLFSFAGDNHEVRAPISAGSVDMTARTIELKVEAAKLVVLDPNLSVEKRAQVQEKMQSDVLESAGFPLVWFRSSHVDEQKADEWLVRGELTLHGQTRPITIRVTRDSSESIAAHYRGTVALKQTDYGMKPVTVAGGTVRVKDEVRLDFDIVLAAPDTSK
jgi:polyisoprenoid-binding protein YceI